MIRSLQSFRFIFAILIFLHHSAVNFQAGGSCGVSFFMILSGFVMTAGYAQKVTEPVFNYKSFLLNRLFRLYPLHLLCLFIFIALQFSSLNYIGYFKLVPNLLLLQSWIPGMNYYFSGNAVSWCLSDMIFFYAMFPLLIRGYQKLNNKLLIWTLLSLGAFYFIILFSIPESYVHRILYISPLFRLLDFIIGILLYQLFLYFQKSGIEEKIGHWSFSRKTGIELLSVLLMALLLLLFPYVSERFICASYYWIPISFLIMVFALFNKTGGGISCLLRIDLFVKLGSISFSFYMIHVLAIRIFGSILNKLNIDLAIGFKISLDFVLILIGSFLIYNYYERPIASLLKRKFK